LYNILSLVFGLLVTGCAAWLVADRGSFFYVTQLHELHEEYSTGTVIDDGAYVVLGIGIAIIIQSIVGCLGAGLGCGGRGKRCLFAYGGLLSLVIVLEIIAVVLALVVYMKEVGAETLKFLESTLQDYNKTDTGVSVVWDNMMTGLGCCGANNYTDFNNIFAADGQIIPESCCMLNENGTMPLDAGCMSSPSATNAYLNGCFELLGPGAVPAIAVTASVIVVFQIAGVILSCCLGCLIEDKREWYQMTSM